MIEDENPLSDKNQATENLVQAVSPGAACACASLKD